MAFKVDIISNKSSFLKKSFCLWGKTNSDGNAVHSTGSYKGSSASMLRPLLLKLQIKMRPTSFQGLLKFVLQHLLVS